MTHLLLHLYLLAKVHQNNDVISYYSCIKLIFLRDVKFVDFAVSLHAEHRILILEKKQWLKETVYSS